MSEDDDDANGASASVAFELDTNPGTLSGRRGIRMSLSGEAMWLDEASDRYQGQLQVTLPLWEGVEIPLTLSVADRSLEDSDTEVRGGVSFTVDTAMLTSWLLRTTAPAPAP